MPYTLDTNDMRFATAQGFNTGEQFFAYLQDAFDVLYAEGDGGDGRRCCRSACTAGSSAGPGGSAALRALPRPRPARTTSVWICRRIDIARHWRADHPFTATVAAGDGAGVA